MVNKVTVVVDMQFGSCGKGLIAGYLAKREAPDTLVHAWMPNAGHTFIDSDGRKFVHCMLPNGIVSPKFQRVMIGPGAVVDIDRLAKEIEDAKDLVKGKDLIIHENAVVMKPEYMQAESTTMTSIGSTKKGCGAAVAAKIRRDPAKKITFGQIRDHPKLRGIMDLHVVNTGTWLKVLDFVARKVLLEGSQGFSLGINSGFYPYVTSRECSVAQILSDTLIPIQSVSKVVGVMRAYPIRVANRYNEQGEMVGWSGPGYPDQRETTFEDIGQPVEFTTVTKLPRRIFTFSRMQTEQAMFLLRPDEVFFNFANYMKPDELAETLMYVQMQAMKYDGEIRYVGFGPSEKDVRTFTEVEDEMASW